MPIGDALQESPACDHQGSLSREWRRHVIRLALFDTPAANLLPFGVYTIPECSMLGTPKAPRDGNGMSYVVGRSRYRDNARGIIGDDTGFLKLFYRADEMRG
jgi:pyruvate/2-oxoglutarate dehydrogenase complex dihydrolipoamide dehydrogenase (E3) component